MIRSYTLIRNTLKSVTYAPCSTQRPEKDTKKPQTNVHTQDNDQKTTEESLDLMAAALHAGLLGLGFFVSKQSERNRQIQQMDEVRSEIIKRYTGTPGAGF